MARGVLEILSRMTGNSQARNGCTGRAEVTGAADRTHWQAGTKPKEPAGTPALRGAARFSCYQLLFLRSVVMWAT